MGSDAVAAASLVMALAVVAGVTLMVRDTLRRRGRWGVNLRPVRCPGCGEPAPAVRRPGSGRQALWGGCTCARCGVGFDKWGRAVAGGGSPDPEPGAAVDQSRAAGD